MKERQKIRGRFDLTRDKGVLVWPTFFVEGWVEVHMFNKITGEERASEKI